MAKYLKQDLDKLISIYCSTFGGIDAPNPFSTVIETVMNEEYQDDIEGVKLYLTEHPDFYAFIASHKMEVLKKDILRKASRQLKEQTLVWLPEFEKGDSSVGLPDEWLTSTEYEAQSIHQRPLEGVYEALHGFLKAQTIYNFEV